MDDTEARKIQKLADFYCALLDIETAFEKAEKEIKTKYSIANNTCAIIILHIRSSLQYLLFPPRHPCLALRNGLFPVHQYLPQLP